MINRVAKGWSYRERRACPRKGSRLLLNMQRTTAIMQSEPLLDGKTGQQSASFEATQSQGERGKEGGQDQTHDYRNLNAHISSLTHRYEYPHAYGHIYKKKKKTIGLKAHTVL